MFFVGHEFKSAEATGRTFTYQGKTLNEAVDNCLYTERLKNGNAFAGITRQVVHSGDRCIAFPGVLAVCPDDPGNGTVYTCNSTTCRLHGERNRKLAPTH